MAYIAILSVNRFYLKFKNEDGGDFPVQAGALVGGAKGIN